MEALTPKPLTTHTTFQGLKKRHRCGKWKRHKKITNLPLTNIIPRNPNPYSNLLRRRTSAMSDRCDGGGVTADSVEKEKKRLLRSSLVLTDRTAAAACVEPICPLNSN